MHGIGARVRLESLETLYKEFSVNHKLILGTHYIDPTHIYFCSGIPVKVEESFLHNRLKFVRFIEDFYVKKFFSEHKNSAQEVHKAEITERFGSSDSVKSLSIPVHEVSNKIPVESSDVGDFMEG